MRAARMLLTSSARACDNAQLDGKRSVAMRWLSLCPVTRTLPLTLATASAMRSISGWKSPLMLALALANSSSPRMVTTERSTASSTETRPALMSSARNPARRGRSTGLGCSTGRSMACTGISPSAWIPRNTGSASAASFRRRPNNSSNSNAAATARPTHGGTNWARRSRLTATPRQCGESSRSRSPRALRIAAAVRSRSASSWARPSFMTR
ncbi:hypothetical protein D3C72_1341320 [compost metagenome]